MRRLCCALLVLGALVTGCVVTDEIEFTDLINHPPEISKLNPPGEVDTICEGKSKSFSVKVWDADEDDLLTAWIFRMRDPFEGGEWESGTFCTQSLDETESEETTGVFLRQECSLRVFGLAEGELIMVKVQVSDLGYQSSGAVTEGSRIAEAIWVLEATEEPEACL